MKGTLSRELLSCVAKEIAERLGQFEPIADNRSPWIWQWRAADNLTLFVLLQPKPDLDQFTLEIAWSESGDFPWGAFGKKAIDRAKGRFRLPDLWKPDALEFWWDVNPEGTAATRLYRHSFTTNKVLPRPQASPDKEVMPRVRALAREAVDKLEQYGLPMFRQVAEVRGLKI